MSTKKGPRLEEARKKRGGNILPQNVLLLFHNIIYVIPTTEVYNSTFRLTLQNTRGSLPSPAPPHSYAACVSRPKQTDVGPGHYLLFFFWRSNIDLFIQMKNDLDRRNPAINTEL